MPWDGAHRGCLRPERAPQRRAPVCGALSGRARSRQSHTQGIGLAASALGWAVSARWADGTGWRTSVRNPCKEQGGPPHSTTLRETRPRPRLAELLELPAPPSSALHSFRNSHQSLSLDIRLQDLAAQHDKYHGNGFVSRECASPLALSGLCPRPCKAKGLRLLDHGSEGAGHWPAISHLRFQISEGAYVRIGLHRGLGLAQRRN